MKKALVVIDVQRAMFEDPALLPFEGEATVERIAALIARARENRISVLFVQHDGGPKSLFHPGKTGFAFHEKLTPQMGDDVTVKRYGSAFRDTDFDAKLKATGVESLIVCGMQSEYCVDAAVRGAAERGYDVVLVADGHSTFDTDLLKAPAIIAHENLTLDGSYARVVRASDVDFSN